MKTKLFLSLFILIFFSSLVMSQGIGILGGVNLNNITGKQYDGKKLENDLKPGFHAGINIQIPVAPEFYFQPGLLFYVKGAKDKDIKETINLNYLELPLNLVYKGLLGQGHVYLGFGPYLGYGISGKLKIDKDEGDIKFKGKVTDQDEPGLYLKPLDVGANAFAGYEFKSGLFVQLNTQLGLINLISDYEDEDQGETSLKNIGFGLSAGFRF